MGAADKFAVLALFAVVDSQDSFPKFCRLADQGSHPHPEDRARTTQKNSGCHTGNVPGADCRGERRHECIERADLSVATRYASLPQKLEAQRDF